MPDEYGKIFGKYEGVVSSTSDPLKGGRLEVLIPRIHGTEKIWAMPCSPYATDGLGFLMLPPKDSKVWVEFMEGDRNKPIWSGCYWSNGRVPSLDPDEMVIATPKAKISMTSKTSDLLIEIKNGAKITINGKTIKIDNGAQATIELDGSTTKINGNGIEVN